MLEADSARFWRRLGFRRFTAVFAIATFTMLAGCSSTASTDQASRAASGGSNSTESMPTSEVMNAPTTSIDSGIPSSPTSSAASGTADVREFLAPLSINDDPHTGADYRRDDWHHWDDIDGDGCDARQQALKAASTIPANVAAGCKVVSGNWISAYDGFMTSNPSELDIDHVVPLENAHISGGWSWDATQRRQYANDQFDLWAVSASANRSKGASPPNQWRPVQQGTWCEYAQRWTAIKIRWDLSATSAERDALGQMLDTCPPGTMFSLSPTPTTIPVTPVTTAPSASASSQPGVASTTYFANCTAARAAGVAPLHTGQPGYRSGLDRDGDGIACE
ncbi:MAG: excalibur calcium-binding domain-containing protein [Actinomycetes bacterium]